MCVCRYLLPKTDCTPHMGGVSAVCVHACVRVCVCCMHMKFSSSIRVTEHVMGDMIYSSSVFCCLLSGAPSWVSSREYNVVDPCKAKDLLDD